LALPGTSLTGTRERAAARCGPRDSAIIAVLLYTGARAGECGRLDLEDIAVTARTGLVRLHGKGDEVRTVPLHAVVEDRSSADLQGVEIGPDAAGNVRFVVGDALGEALVRPGRVVVRPVFSQDCLQMSLANDQHAIQELATQGSDQALADRVAPHRQLHPIRMIGTGVSG
jgi:hypothetical protein